VGKCSAGTFAATPQGWEWRTEQGAVNLGAVKVVDATGQTVPATMEVTTEETRITVAGTALAQATYPVTIDPEIGANDFRISDMGPDGNSNFDAFNPAVAYNSIDNEYLVVWEGDDNTPPLVDQETEIFGQRLNAATGAQIGENHIRLSDMGPDGAPNFVARAPAMAYNSTNNESLVVWRGDDNTPPLVDNEFEVYGQRFTTLTIPLVAAVLPSSRSVQVGPPATAPAIPGCVKTSEKWGWERRSFCALLA
jgi:hypothetical protein